MGAPGAKPGTTGRAARSRGVLRGLAVLFWRFWILPLASLSLALRAAAEDPPGPREVPVSGQVLLSSDGAPVAGVDVRLVLRGYDTGEDHLVWSGRTDATGHFHIPDVPSSRTFSLSVRGPSLPLFQPFDLVATGTVARTLPPLIVPTPKCTLGRVLDATGAPLARAHVSLVTFRADRPPDALYGSSLGGGRIPVFETASDDDGRFALWQSPIDEDALLQVTLPGFAPRVLVVHPEIAGPLELQMERGLAVTGRVLDDLGDPVVGVRVTARPRLLAPGEWLELVAPEALSGPEGRFVLQGLLETQVYSILAPDAHQGVVWSAARGRGPFLVVVPIPEVQHPRDEDADEDPPRLGRFQGRVLDARTGEPLEGAQVELWPPGHSKHAESGAATDAEGRFLVDGLFPDDEYLLTVRAPGHHPVFGDEILRNGLVEKTYRLEPLEPARVRLVRRDGSAASGVPLFVWAGESDLSHIWSYAMTDRDGRAMLLEVASVEAGNQLAVSNLWKQRYGSSYLKRVEPQPSTAGDEVVCTLEAYDRDDEAHEDFGPLESTPENKGRWVRLQDDSGAPLAGRVAKGEVADDDGEVWVREGRGFSMDDALMGYVSAPKPPPDPIVVHRRGGVRVPLPEEVRSRLGRYGPSVRLSNDRGDDPAVHYDWPLLRADGSELLLGNLPGGRWMVHLGVWGPFEPVEVGPVDIALGAWTLASAPRFVEGARLVVECTDLASLPPGDLPRRSSGWLDVAADDILGVHDAEQDGVVPGRGVQEVSTQVSVELRDRDGSLLASSTCFRAQGEFLGLPAGTWRVTAEAPEIAYPSSVLVEDLVPPDTRRVTLALELYPKVSGKVVGAAPPERGQRWPFQVCLAREPAPGADLLDLADTDTEEHILELTAEGAFRDRARDGAYAVELLQEEAEAFWEFPPALIDLALDPLPPPRWRLEAPLRIEVGRGRDVTGLEVRVAPVVPPGVSGKVTGARAPGRQDTWTFGLRLVPPPPEGLEAVDALALPPGAMGRRVLSLARDGTFRGIVAEGTYDVVAVDRVVVDGADDVPLALDLYDVATPSTRWRVDPPVRIEAREGVELKDLEVHVVPVKGGK